MHEKLLGFHVQILVKKRMVYLVGGLRKKMIFSHLIVLLRLPLR